MARVLTFFLVVIAVKYVGVWRRQLPRFMIWIMIVHTLLSLLALLLFPMYPTPLVVFGQDAGSSLSINGFFLEPNLYGAYVLCVVGLLLAAFLYSSADRMGGLIAAGIIAFVGLVLSYTRSAWLGLIVLICCLAVSIMLRSNQRSRRLFLLIVGVVILLLAYFLVILFSLDLWGLNLSLADRVRGIVDARSNSAGTRTIIWTFALESWRDHMWLGNGPLSFPLIRGWLFSSLVQTLHDTGLVGLFFMVWICLGCLIYTWQGFIRATAMQDRGILLGYVLAQIGLFFTSQFSSFFWGGFTWVLFGLAVGHSMTIGKATHRQFELPREDD